MKTPGALFYTSLRRQRRTAARPVLTPFLPLLCTFVRSRARFSTQPAHIASEKISDVEHTTLAPSYANPFQIPNPNGYVGQRVGPASEHGIPSMAGLEWRPLGEVHFGVRWLATHCLHGPLPGRLGLVMGRNRREEALNAAGQIVGFSEGASGINGFLLTGGSYITLKAPNAGMGGTQASGINASGQIVGGYYDANSIGHGFLYGGGNYTTLDVPGADFTRAIGINDAGQIVGFYQHGNTSPHAFLYSDGSYVTFDFPGAISTVANGINNAGQIVGSYNGSQGFLAAPIPEPSTLVLFTIGAFSTIGYLWRWWQLGGGIR